MYAAPVGLPGAFRITHRVRSVIASRSSSAVSLKSLSSEQSTTTGEPSLTSTMSGYETQYGAGMITSAPSSTVAVNAMKMTCLAPPPTAIWLSV